MPPQAENKTEKPTARRRQKARQEGQVPQSMEVNSVLVLLAGFGALALFGQTTLTVLVNQVTERLGSLHGPQLDTAGSVTVLREAAGQVLSAAAPVLVGVGIMGLLCSLAQTGVLFTPKKMKPDLNAVNPVRGFKELFSLQALQRMAVAFAKFGIVGAVSYTIIRSRLGWLQALVGKSVWGIVEVTRDICASLVFRLLAVMALVAVLDYLYQRWRHERKLMMSRAEVKEEHKREEGDPEIAARRAAQRRSMLRRMISAVPDADVVITNPDHVAVALQWDEQTMQAPKVVAKGCNHMAERIKRVAEQNGVPVLERRPLARALYSAVEVGMQIPPELYYAVAQVLAFVLGHGRAA